MTITRKQEVKPLQATPNKHYKRNQWLQLAIGVLSLLFLIAMVTINVSDKKIDTLNKTNAELTDKITEVGAEQFKVGYEEGKSEGIIIGKTQQSKLSDKPFKPNINEHISQSRLALALAVYGESRSEKPIDREIIAWAIINRVLDDRDDKIYRNTMSAVVAADGQYDGVNPYLGVISQIVWGERLNYVPKSARVSSSKDGKAWLEIVDMVDDILAGNRSRKTMATHFCSPSAAKGGSYCSWMPYLKPLNPAGKHLMYVDYAMVDGKLVKFTKENPYDPVKHG